MNRHETAATADNQDPLERLAIRVMHGCEKIELSFDRLDDRIIDLRTELSSIRRDVEDLNRKVQAVSGYSKEINSLMDRIRAVETHLGINQEIIC
jgi:archaellum component FlaC